MDRDSAIKYMHDMLRLLKKKGGSDLYVTAGTMPMMKLNGKLEPLAHQRLKPAHTQLLTRSIMNDRQAKEFDASNECNFAISLPGISRFRISAYVQRGSVAMVLRVIATTIPSFDSLSLPPILTGLVMAKRGLIIVVGGTGSGKSTSLAAMIDYRNENSFGHIITIEDPVEFVHQHKGCVVSQREVGTDTESFEIALKNSLRQAPDVILIGEIRDRETMEHAIAFSETGHLCLATLHANSSSQAMDRIINFFPEERRQQLLLDLSLNLRAVISQRLIRAISGDGMRAAVEILINTPLMSDLILKGDISAMKLLMSKSTEVGMQSFDHAIFNLIVEQAIAPEDGFRNAESVNDLRLRLKLESNYSDSLMADNVQLSIEEHDE
ncbi:MAG: PilT/PilU family type 4a pilus ATPase [Gammaproteobacteria bacterium]|nr:PilT/PilU family type 4a pilus ATPase [Gammaproteobacteria bacterium]